MRSGLPGVLVRRARVGELADFAMREESEGATPEPASEGDWITQVIQRKLPLVEARQEVVREFERRYLRATLASAGGNVSQAAQLAKIPRRYFQLLRAKRGT